MSTALVEKKINPKHVKFVEEYCKDFNGKQAYMRTYPDSSPEAANPSVAALLLNPMVIDLIAARRKQISEVNLVEASEVIQEFKKIAFSNIGDFINWSGKTGTIALEDFKKLSRDQLACFSEISEIKTAQGHAIKFKLHDKIKALEHLGSYLGIFKDKADATTQGNFNLVTEEVEAGI